MDRLIELKRLSDEAVDLLKKLLKEGCMIGTSPCREVMSNTEGDTIILKDIKNKTIQYSLSEIGHIFTDDHIIYNRSISEDVVKRIKEIQKETENLQKSITSKSYL